MTTAGSISGSGACEHCFRTRVTESLYFFLAPSQVVNCMIRVVGIVRPFNLLSTFLDIPTAAGTTTQSIPHLTSPILMSIQFNQLNSTQLNSSNVIIHSTPHQQTPPGTGSVRSKPIPTQPRAEFNSPHQLHKKHSPPIKKPRSK